MSRYFTSLLTLSVILRLGSPVFAGKTGEGNKPSSIITIRIYNLAQVPATILAEAEKEGTRIFCDAGIKIVWLECPLVSPEITRLQGCQPSLSPKYLNLRIIPRFDASFAGFSNTTLGFALPANEGGVHASIFYHRIELIAQTGMASQSQVLGHAIAHEVGHLLLGSNSHSPAGLMSARWNRQDLHRVTLDILRFTPKQAELMRFDLAARRKLQAEWNVEPPSRVISVTPPGERAPEAPPRGLAATQVKRTPP